MAQELQGTGSKFGLPLGTLLLVWLLWLVLNRNGTVDIQRDKVWLLFVLGLFSLALFIINKAWEKLAESTAKKIFQKVDSFFGSPFFLRRYCSVLQSKNFMSFFGMHFRPGLNLSMEEIYTEPTISLLSNLRRKSNHGGAAITSLSLNNLIHHYERDFRIIIVAGKPGAGKTTMLLYLQWKLASEFSKKGRVLPIYMHLGEVAKAVLKSETEPSLAELLSHDWREASPPKNWFAQRLYEDGENCIVLLDGLDEIASLDDRKKIALWIERQAHRHYPQVRFIVTTRYHGLMTNFIEAAIYVEINDFTKEQIRDLVTKCFRAKRESEQKKVEGGTVIKTVAHSASSESDEKALQQKLIDSDALLSLARNPLLLMMIILFIMEAQGNLPEDRAKLYDEIIYMLLQKHPTGAPSEARLWPSRKRQLLRKLAFSMMSKQQREMLLQDAEAILMPELAGFGIENKEDLVDAFVQSMHNEYGLLIQDQNKFRFTHLTYQEYLAAEEIKELDEQRELIESELAQFIEMSWWHETLLLYSKISNPTTVIKYCLEKYAGQIDRLVLAYELDQNARDVDTEIRKKLRETIDIDSDDREKQVLKADFLLRCRLRRLIPPNDSPQIDRYLVSNVEYQRFIDETERYPDHATGKRFKPGTGSYPVVEVRFEDANEYAKWLTQKVQKFGFEHKQYHFRLPKADELAGIDLGKRSGDPDPYLGKLLNSKVAVWCTNQKGECTTSMDGKAEAELREAQKLLSQQQILKIKRERGFAAARLKVLFDHANSFETYLHAALGYIRKTNDSTDASLPDQWEHLRSEADRFQKKLRVTATRFKKQGCAFELNVRACEKIVSRFHSFQLEKNAALRKEAAPSDHFENLKTILLNSQNEIKTIKKEIELNWRRAIEDEGKLLKIVEDENEGLLGKGIDLKENMMGILQLREKALGQRVASFLDKRDEQSKITRLLRLLIAVAERRFYRASGDSDEVRLLLKAYWSLFWIQQRIQPGSPVPAWEGIRLVRERLN